MKNMLIAGAGILFLCGALLILAVIKEPQAYHADQVSDVALRLAQEGGVAMDSDNDGLADWEETVWGTDKNNPDTDGDGTNDGDEIAENRDPTVPAPGDTLSRADFKERNSSVQKADSTNTTERIATAFFSEYLSRRTEKPLSTAEEEAIISSLIAQSTESTYTVYTAGDISITSQYSLADIRTYGNMLGESLFANSPDNLENEFVLFSDALEAGSEADIVKLDPIISGYAGFVRDMLAMPVPERATLHHLRLLNASSALLSIIRDMRAVFVDPLRGLNAVGSYEAAASELGSAMSEMQSFFSGQGISFSPQEGGYVFK